MSEVSGEKSAQVFMKFSTVNLPSAVSSSSFKHRDFCLGMASPRFSLLFCLLGVLALQSSAQIASPYSRFGLGYVRSTVFSANKAMGEVAGGYASNSYINYTNPASYASLTRTTIEAGLNIDDVNIRTKSKTYNAVNGSVSHVAVAFVPKADKWAISVGLLPFSNTNYTFVQDFNDSAIGSYRKVYSGKGSLYRLYAGGAYKFKSRINELDNFSIGANISYVFGKLDNQNIITFPDSLRAYSSRSTVSMNVNGVSYNAGFQYRRRIYHNSDREERTDIYFTLGGYASGGVKVNTKTSSYWDRINISSTGVSVIDSQQVSSDSKGKVLLPVTAGGGFMFGNERFWQIGADFRWTNWKKYQSPFNNGNLADSWRIGLGVQIVPKYGERKYLSNVQYRLGGYYASSEITYQGKALTEYGGTLGLGLPLYRNLASLNLSADIGSRGGDNAAVIRETYYRFTLGFTLNDPFWFIKRKFD